MGTTRFAACRAAALAIGIVSGVAPVAAGPVVVELFTSVPVGPTREGALPVRVGAGASSGTVTMVEFDPRHVTSVAPGVNAGRTLAQANVARSVAEIGHRTVAAQVWTVPRRRWRGSVRRLARSP